MSRMPSAPELATPAPSARDRMLRAAKTLFAEKGFENVSTATIARLSGSSESQLVKHFGGKHGLLAEIFNEGWNRITQHVGKALEFTPTPAAKLHILAQTVISDLEQDQELKTLFLLEGRRVRKGASITMTKGFLEFVRLVDSV